MISTLRKTLLSAAMMTLGCTLSAPSFSDSQPDKLWNSSALNKVSGRLANILPAKSTSGGGVSRYAPQEQPVSVDVRFDGNATKIRETLEAAGLRVELASDEYRRAIVLVKNSGELETLNNLESVVHVTIPEKGTSRAGLVGTQLIQSMETSRLYSAPYNLSGEGVKIGIISDSFARTAAVRGDSASLASCAKGILENTVPQKSGDLPASVEIRRDDSGGCENNDDLPSDEGAGMAELIHDLAPSASLAFHTAGSSQLAMAMAIDDLCKPLSEGGAGSDIVVDDIFFTDQSIYQNDIVAQAAENCVKRGVHYFSAAGNDGDQAFQFTFKDVNPAKRDVTKEAETIKDSHDWGNGDAFMQVVVQPGDSFQAHLHWNQPTLSAQKDKKNFPQVDLDLYLLKEPGELTQSNVIAVSNEEQIKGVNSADPVEGVSYENETDRAQAFYINVNFWDGVRGFIPQSDAENIPTVFTLLIYKKGDVQFEYPFSGSTMLGHTNANGVNSVAAVPWYDTDAYDKTLEFTNEIDPEAFTARGGVIQKYYANDGSFRKAQVTVPTMAAVNGVNTTFFGNPLKLGGRFGEPDNYPNFFGTSASAPIAAASAALALQKLGAKQPTNALTDIMLRTAQDIKGQRAAEGPDDVTGRGLIRPQQMIDSLPTITMADATAAPQQKITLNATANYSGHDLIRTRWTFSRSGEVIEKTTQQPTIEMFAPEVPGTYSASLNVEFRSGLVVAERFALTVGGASFFSVNAGNDFQAQLGRATSLTALVSARGEMKLKSIKWTKLSGPDVAMGRADQAKLNLTFTENGRYRFKVKALAENGAFSEDEVVVSVGFSPETPDLSLKVSAPDTVEVGKAVGIKATVADTENQSVTYQWQVKQGGATLQNAQNQTVIFNANIAGSIELQVTVKAADGRSASQIVTLLAKGNAPTTTPGPQTPASPDSDSGSSGGGTMPIMFVFMLLLCAVGRRKPR
ncbi:PKD domain-containing protein [Bacterioplanoides sp.]|uniref:PKD domain-containing protein n=1 Tax=Bacterioplanoides sp. TaxID=2066072 RepID=UPI003B5B4614